MNLHNIVSGAIGMVNSHIPVTIKVSQGYTTDTDGRQWPMYTITNATGQKQSLSTGDIMRLNSLSVQGVAEKMYLSGNHEGMFRVLGKGGDLIIFGGRTYLVSAVLERWPDWCCVALTMQVDP